MIDNIRRRLRDRRLRRAYRALRGAGYIMTPRTQWAATLAALSAENARVRRMTGGNKSRLRNPRKSLIRLIDRTAEYLAEMDRPWGEGDTPATTSFRARARAVRAPLTALLLIGLAGCAPATPLETANAVMAILLFVGGTAAVGAGLAWVLEKKQGWKFLPVVLLGALAVSMAIDFMVTHPEPGLPHHTTHSALEPVR